MIKKWLLKLEDQAMPLLGPNVKALKFFGLLLSEKNRSRNVIYFANYCLFLQLLLVLEWIEFWHVKTNVDLLLNNLRFSLVSSVTVFKICAMVSSQKQWKEIIKYITRTDILFRQEVDDSCRKIVKSYTKYSRKLTYIYWATLYGVVLTIIIQLPTPLFMYYASNSFQESVKNGSMKMEHVISFWVPFDKYYNVAGFSIVAIYETCVDLYSGCLITSFDAIVMVIMVFFRGELEILRRLGSRMFEDDDNAVVRRNLIEFKRRHDELIKYANMFNSCISPIMFVYLLISSFSICACAYQIKIEPKISQKLLKVHYTVFGVTQLFMYCWHGNSVIFQSFDPMQGVYESGWWKRPTYRRELILLMMQTDRTIIFKAGPTFTLSVEVFLAILKGAYSYYTVTAK